MATLIALLLAFFSHFGIITDPNGNIIGRQSGNTSSIITDPNGNFTYNTNSQSASSGSGIITDPNGN